MAWYVSLAYRILLPQRSALVVLSAVLSVVLFGSPSPAEAASVLSPADSRKLDASFRRILKTHVLPSVAVGIWQPGKTPYRFVGGIADLPTGSSRRPDQPFRIASITKAFVAVAVLQLVEAGRLRKSQTLAQWYPKFPNASLITIDDLLRMRSGIAAPDDDVVLASVYDHPLAKHPNVEDDIAAATALRAKFVAPNTKGVYTDLNYMLLGEIVKRVTGHDIGYFIRHGIVERLHLRGTWYPTTSALPGGLHGYGWNRATHRFEDKTLFEPLLAGPAGAMISTLDDLHLFARAVCRGGLLDATTQRAMLAGQPLAGTNVRYGEGVISDAGICGHSGTINGFNSDIYHLPKTDTTIVINVNRLDKDNHARTTPYLSAVIKLMTKPSAP